MKLTIVSLFLLMSVACQVERMFPGRVADGVARLSVANFGLLMMGRYSQEQNHALIPDECRLAQVNVKASTQIVAQAQGRGEVRQRFSNCRLDFGARYEVKDPSNQILGHLSGAVTVSGERIVKGYLTGNSLLPIIPQGGDAIQFHFSRIEFDNFHAKLASLDEDLRLVKGTASLNVTFHLARNKHGLCAEPIQNITLDNIAYSSGTVARLPGMFGHFDVDIGESQFSAQQGVYEDKRNMLEGSMTVWNTRVQLNGDDRGLDPNWDVTTWDPKIRYDCPVDEFMALSTSRLLMLNVGVLTLQVVDHQPGLFAWNCSPTNCDIRNPLNYKSENEASRTIANCCMHTPEIQEIDRDCNGTKTFVEGTAIVNYKTKLRGKWQGLFTRPTAVHPENTLLKFEDIHFVDYAASTQREDETAPFAKLVLKNGSLSARVKPILAAQKHSPCEFNLATPNAFIHEVQGKAIDAVVEVDLSALPVVKGLVKLERADDAILKLPLHIDTSKLSAQNGAYGGTKNWLSGDIRINGRNYTIPPNTNLAPDFDQGIFDKSYACKPTLFETIKPAISWNPTAHCSNQ